MEEVKKEIEIISDKKNLEDMEELGEIFRKMLCMLEKDHPEKAKKYRMKIHIMAYGEVLTEDMAKEIVHEMKPAGEHWNIEQTTAVKNEYGITDISDVDFYISMNKSYNDNKDTVEYFLADESQRLEMYVRLTKDFINDIDARPGKVFRYFIYEK